MADEGEAWKGDEAHEEPRVCLLVDDGVGASDDQIGALVENLGRVGAGLIVKMPPGVMVRGLLAVGNIVYFHVTDAAAMRKAMMGQQESIATPGDFIPM